MRISENPQTPILAKEVQLLCPHCNTACVVKLPWNPTSQQRQELIHNAIEEHRKTCLKADSDAGRITQISYPRS